MPKKHAPRIRRTRKPSIKLVRAFVPLIFLVVAVLIGAYYIYQSTDNRSKAYNQNLLYVGNPKGDIREALQTMCMYPDKPCRFSDAQSLARTGATLYITEPIGSINVTKPGIRIYGGTVDASLPGSTSDAAITVNADDVTLENIIVTGGTHYGIKMGTDYFYQRIILKGLRVTGNGTAFKSNDGRACQGYVQMPQSAGIYAANLASLKIENTEVTDNCAPGFSVYYSSMSQITSSIFANNYPTQLVFDQTGDFEISNSRIECTKDSFAHNGQGYFVSLLASNDPKHNRAVLTRRVSFSNNQFVGCKAGLNYLKEVTGDFSQISFFDNTFYASSPITSESIPGFYNYTSNNIQSPLSYPESPYAYVPYKPGAPAIWSVPSPKPSPSSSSTPNVFPDYTPSPNPTAKPSSTPYPSTPSPSSTPKPSSTPTPSVTPQPTAVIVSPTPYTRPSINPSATPVPLPSPSTAPITIINRFPLILTASLPRAKVNQTYTTTVSGYDVNRDDKLYMTASNLPGGLTLSNCVTTKQTTRARINCRISGRPTTAATYPVTFILKDSQGAISTKTLSLRVVK